MDSPVDDAMMGKMHTFNSKFRKLVSAYTAYVLRAPTLGLMWPAERNPNVYFRILSKPICQLASLLLKCGTSTVWNAFTQIHRYEQCSARSMYNENTCSASQTMTSECMILQTCRRRVTFSSSSNSNCSNCCLCLWTSECQPFSSNYRDNRYIVVCICEMCIVAVHRSPFALSEERVPDNWFRWKKKF